MEVCFTNGIMRHIATSSLPIEDLLKSSLETVRTLKGVKLEKIDNFKVKEKGFLDKIWRKNLRIPDSPKSSLKRSLSSTSKSRARTDERSREEENNKKRSRSSSQSKIRP